MDGATAVHCGQIAWNYLTEVERNLDYFLRLGKPAGVRQPLCKI